MALWRRASLYVVIATQGAMTQTTNAHCKDPADWSPLGTPNLDVCGITRELMRTCGVDSLQKLQGSQEWYHQPEFPPVAANCTCSTVMYNLLSACAGCQKWDMKTAELKSWPSLSEFQEGLCMENSPELNWTQPIPPWSNELDDFGFNLTRVLAEVRVQGSESSTTTTDKVLLPTNTPTDSPPSSPSPSATTTSSNSSSSSRSGPNVGLIVGVVIGILALLGIAGLGFWLHRRQRRARDVPPSAEFLKPEYYATPPLLSGGHDRRDPEYHDDIDAEAPEMTDTNRRSWIMPGLVTNRAREEDDGDMLPPFTRGTYIGPSPHEKGVPERSDTAESDATSAPLLPSTSRRPGPSGYFP